MSRGHLEVDCTRRCRSRNHGQAITSAITKRSVSDASLASFIKATCANFTQAFDFEGRTALHMAASRGRTKLMEWLSRHSIEAFINARDRESGYTPLHRSIFYGQIHTAVTLMKIGVNTEIVDKDDYRALEHAMLDRQYMYKQQNRDGEPRDVYMWGSNSNYTLGTGTQQQKKTPDLLNCFSRNNQSIKQVCLGKFHSVWLCSGQEGCDVYACGQLARAGATVATSLRPVLLKLSEPCVQAAVTLDSTVLLMQSGTVLQYSLNTTDNALSQSNTKTPSIIKLPSVKPLIKLSEPIGICASRVHAVLWNIRAVYTWGTNLGQLGHSQPTDKYIETPSRVAISLNNKEEAGIQLAGASDAATVFTTSRGDVYLLHKHICKKIAIKQINLRQVSVDAKVNEHGVHSRVTVLMLTNVGQLLLWQDTTNKVTRCIFGLSHQTSITHITMTHDGIFFTTKYGEAFIGNISRRNPSPTQQTKKDKDRDSSSLKREKDSNKSALVKFLEKDDCTNVRITRIPNVHRAVSITVDSEGLNFACLQVKPTCGLTSIPDLSPSSMLKHMDALMETAVEEDILHDVVFKVGTKQYPAHVYIIASGSEHLHKLYEEMKQKNPEEIPIIILPNVIPEVFDRILKYLYTGTCDVAELGPCGLRLRREDLVKAVKKEDNELEEDLYAIENPLEISAFEVYKGEKTKKQKMKKQRSTETPPRTSIYCDPVKLVQATAKRLQVKGLHKLLEKFYYRDGSIHLKEKASPSKNPSPSWDREQFAELVDTHVRSKDGVEIPAHKCVLAARLEYFYGMFMHSWSESKLLSTVSLPINHSILLPVINFLYSDSCPEIETSDSIDFITSLLIVADQLFITRLKEMCESALANMITLKNCSELCQFAHTYNATQLKQCCMEFISLNICSILENRTLEILDDSLVEDITRYYCKFNPIMSSRVITPFYNAPADEIINESEKNLPIDLDVTDEDYKNNANKDDSKKKRSSKKIEYTDSEKARKRYESVSSVNSLDLSLDTSGDITLSLSKISKDTDTSKRDSWIEVPTAQQKHQKIVQSRLKARDIVNNEPPINLQFTPLTKSSSKTIMSTSPVAQETFFPPMQSRMSVSPTDSPLTELARSPQGNIVISHIGPKLSQKQRKKLATQSNESPTPQTLDNYFSNRLQISSPPEKLKNPWKICEVPSTSSPIKSKAVEFNQILADQKKQKDDSSRIMTKPLNLTQLEDKAIEELERFYNVHEIDDELISVRRIELQVSSPQWPHTATK